MRFLIAILLVVFLAVLATFAVMNIDERVDVHLPGRDFIGVPQLYLVLGSLLAGIFFVGLLSVIDGTRLRLANRRLRREIARLREVGVGPALGKTPEKASPPSRPRAVPPIPATEDTRPDRPVITGSEDDADETPYGV
jgi:uncharacterized integral membrane protein